MPYTPKEIRGFINQVVSEAKRTARVDTGFLRRSIRGRFFKGRVEFREIFYGAYNDNSKLIQIAQRIMPDDLDWKVIFVDENGIETPVKGKTRTGRNISRSAILSGSASTSKIKSLIASLRKSRKQREAENTAENG